MSDDAALLDGEQVRSLLIELGSRLDRRDLDARLFLVGGAAMAIAFNLRRTTRDLDAVFEPKSEVYAEAERMAHDLGLAENWLNDGVKGLLPDLAAPEVGVRFAAPGISVEVASAEYLFAMKALASRVDVDGEDLRLLARHLGLATPDQAFAIVERFYSGERIRPVTRYLIEDVISSVQQGHG